jgi:hypothetical protein
VSTPEEQLALIDAAAAAVRGSILELPPVEPGREVVMQMSPGEHDRLNLYRKILEKEYGTDGLKETVLKAMEAEAYRLNQGAE